MIFATDASGANIFSSPDWARLTGQPEVDAQGAGWAAQIHEDDRAIVAAAVQRAVRLQMSFSTRHRLRFADGTYHWVASGAVPSYCPRRGLFLGFMGSVSEIDPPEPRRASGWLGPFEPPPPPATLTNTGRLDRAVDYLLFARSLLPTDEPRADAIAKALDLALYLYGQTPVRQ